MRRLSSTDGASRAREEAQSAARSQPLQTWSGFSSFARSVAEAPPRDDDDDAADAFQIQTLENDALPLDEALSTRMNEEGSPALPTK